MSATPTYDKLRARLKAFVRAYVETGIGAKSIRACGFTGKRPDLGAQKLLRKPQVRQAIREYELTMQETVRQRIYANLRRLELIAGWDPALILDEAGNYLPLDRWPEEARLPLQGIEVEELFEGRGEDRVHVGRLHKYRLASKLEAAKLIMQYQRLLDDRPPVQVNVNTQGDAQVNVISSTDPIEASLEYERLMFKPQPELPRLPAPQLTAVT